MPETWSHWKNASGQRCLRTSSPWHNYHLYINAHWIHVIRSPALYYQHGGLSFTMSHWALSNYRICCRSHVITMIGRRADVDKNGKNHITYVEHLVAMQSVLTYVCLACLLVPRYRYPARETRNLGSISSPKIGGLSVAAHQMTEASSWSRDQPVMWTAEKTVMSPGCSGISGLPGRIRGCFIWARGRNWTISDTYHRRLTGFGDIELEETLRRPDWGDWGDIEIELISVGSNEKCKADDNGAARITLPCEGEGAILVALNDL